MEQEREMQTIFLKDLFFVILHKWKQMIIAILVGALLLGGLQFLDNQKAKKQINKLPGEEMSQREQLQQAIDNNDLRIETQQAYLSVSPLMSIDPNQVYQSTLVLYVHTNYKIQPNLTYQNPDSMPAILSAYQRVLSDGTVIIRIAEQTELPAEFLHELITSTPTASHPGILTITVNAKDEQTSNMLLSALMQTMKDASASISEQTADHKLTCQTYPAVMRSDTTIATLQEQALQRLASLQDQKLELEKMQTNIVISSDEASPLLYAVIGAVLGAFVICAWSCIHHIGSKKVYSERTLKNRTGIKILGRAPSTDRHSKAGLWLRKAEGRANSLRSLDVVAANIRNQSIGAGGVLLIGTAPKEDRDALQTALTNAAVTFTDGGNLLTDPTAFDQLATCSAVLLIEKCNHSTYDDITRVLEYVADKNKPVIGCVLLDA